MDVSIRTAESEAERAEWVRTFLTAMHEASEPDVVADCVRAYADAACYAAYDGDRMVGSAGDWRTELTVPGRATVPAAAVTFVGVLPTHRRRGILRGLMHRQLRDCAERGDKVAILGASEAVIYGRFGYGPATTDLRARFETPHTEFVAPADLPGSFHLVDADEAAKVLPAVFEAIRIGSPGEIWRSAEYWRMVLRDRPEQRGGRGPLQHVVHRDASGTPDGYASYRVEQKWRQHLPASELHVFDLYGASHDVEAALWRYCVEVDLVVGVEGWIVPDTHLRWRLADPRQLRVTDIGDGLWVRILDVPGALAAREYLADGRLVLEVEDPLFEANSRRWSLAISQSRVDVTPTDDEPDLRLGVASLGSVYLGGIRPSVLADAGRVRAASEDALRRADTMFASRVPPSCHSEF